MPQCSVLQAERYGLPNLMQSIQFADRKCKRVAGNRFDPHVRLVSFSSQYTKRRDGTGVYREFALIAPAWNKEYPHNIFRFYHPIQPCSITTDRGAAADVGSPRQDERYRTVPPTLS